MSGMGGFWSFYIINISVLIWEKLIIDFIQVCSYGTFQSKPFYYTAQFKIKRPHTECLSFH